jgi:hypothetical protein
MKYTTTAIARLVLVLGLAAILAPAAFAKGGVTVRTFAPPPLDAGSALPNPDYSSQRVRPDDRADRSLVNGNGTQLVTRSSGDAFDWGDAGIGAGGAFIVALCLTPIVLTVRQAGRKSLART